MAALETEGARPAFGLLGRKLGHSWSPRIHAVLGSAPYALVELEPDELGPYVREQPWSGLNVTIPYKQSVVELADEATPRVRRLGAANTLVRRADGSIFADNTDVFGFSWLLERFCKKELGSSAPEVLGDRTVLVLGSGGASKAVLLALEEVGARPVVISRKGPDNYGSLGRHADAALVVNTTPVGMYPDCPASPLPPEAFDTLGQLRGVIDVVYNPRRTGLCLEAERRGLPYDSGMAMLVAQALRSSELFQGHALDDDLIPHIERMLDDETRNIALIGMPGAGKTTTGRQLAHLLARPFVDLDDAFEMRFGMGAGSYIEQHGEDAFRTRESEVLAYYGAQSGIVMACGGGVVTRERNRDLLRQNSVVVMIDRPLDQLSSDGRPLSQAKGIGRLARERMGLYRLWADHTVRCTGGAAGDAEQVRLLLGLAK